MCISARRKAIDCFLAMASPSDAILGVGDAFRHHTTREPHHDRADGGAGAGQQVADVTSRLAAQAIRLRDLHPLELERNGGEAAQSEILLGLGDAEASGLPGDDEGVEALSVGGHHQEVTGAITQGHEGLDPREHEAVTLGLGHGAGLERVEHGAVLADGEGCCVELLGTEEREEPLLLILGAVVDDGVGEGRGRHGRYSEASVAVAELLQQDGVGDGRARFAASAVLLRNLGRRQTKLPDGIEEVLRYRRLLVAVAGDGAHRLVRKLLQRIANDFLFFTESERDHALLLSLLF
jgi:hypothetical protein